MRRIGMLCSKPRIMTLCCAVALWLCSLPLVAGECTPPVNEVCDGALVFSNAQLPLETVMPLGCVNNMIDRPYFDAFFQFDCTKSGTYTIDMCGSTGDTYIRIYNEGCGWADGEELAVGDDECPGSSPPPADPRISLDLEAGQSYWIEVGTWREDPPWAPPPNSPYILRVSLDGSETAITQLPQVTIRSSVDTDRIEANHFSFRAALSTDGRYVAFHSRADNLVAGDFNDEDDVFVHDNYSGKTVRVSVDSTGAEGNGDSRDPSISADGRYVTFRSDSTDLVAGDNNGWFDIFVHDRDTDGDGLFDEAGSILTERISVNSAGVEADAPSYSSSISADGNLVAFDSAGTNLDGVEINALDDVFLRDRQSQTTVRVTVDSNEILADNGGDWPSISADGRHVAFESLANNLVVGDTNLKTDIFVRDLLLGTTTRVSVASDGSEVDDTSLLFDTHHVISGDGRRVVFTGRSSQLVSGDTNGTFDIFVHDRDADDDGIFDEPGAVLTSRVSVDSSGAEAMGGSSEHANISDDGRYVVFDSAASNLVAGGTGTRDIYIHDLHSGTTEQISVNSSGVTSNGTNTDPTVANGGRTSSYHSSATNLDPTDFNGRDDIFTRAPASPVCLDTRDASFDLIVYPEPVGGCPVSPGGISREFVRGQISDVTVALNRVRLGPVRCEGGASSTLEEVVTARDLDVGPGNVRFYLWRGVGDTNFGSSSDGLPRITSGATPCP